MRIGLRIDVDTFRGTKSGVPALCEMLADQSILASFFFSVGPDNMGRHLWRLLRPAFLFKMLRSKAATLYGWDILLKGTFWPGPQIGWRLAQVIHAASQAGHECGFHAWDHQRWQAHIDTMGAGEMHASLERGVRRLAQITCSPPAASAAPGWKCNNLLLAEETKFPFRYNSDCRGHSIFLPVVDGKELSQPQIPTTLPTYDEVIGRNGVSDFNYNDHLLSLLRPDGLNVLTIHAEVEGGACAGMFAQFLRAARAKGAEFAPLGRLLDDCPRPDRACIAPGTVPGREGWVACQAG